MKQNKSPTLLHLLCILLIAVLLTMHYVAPIEAKRGHGKKAAKPHKPSKHRGRHKADHGPSTGPAMAPPDKPSIFDVLSYGAKGDGESDDSKALVAAWKVACKVPSSTLRIPPELKFLIKPVTLQGPCASDLVLLIDGTLLAPPKVGSWPKSSWFQWLNFKWVQNFTIRGTGMVDGQGSNWWSLSDQVQHIQRKLKHVPHMKPTAVRFYSSYNVTVRDISIVNSPLCHLKFDNSAGVKVTNVTISSPGDSPNTDGIHLQNTRDTEIEHSNIGCGDDCVSIQTGCANVHVHHINCGPGHGISLGGLGKDKSVACVSNITVENSSLQSTMYGLRIKTWQGGLGSVENVSFSNVQVSNVKVPIAIDQYYCDKVYCRNQSKAVAITGVKFDQIVGVQLKPSPRSEVALRQTLCYNSYGKSTSPLLPSSIDGCLRSESGSIKRTLRSHEILCR
ncbi:hypothetical protein CDL15_Pgr009732 [Punica granatum]|uniref:Polygalacturonase At1g48100 n=1 Tax=Punica granatum TaxID=22663 RepID=A0A218WU16_PUNGR|nr:hypothetical protein CDL15_Pgr009732 [Punica granatum]